MVDFTALLIRLAAREGGVTLNEAVEVLGDRITTGPLLTRSQVRGRFTRLEVLGHVRRISGTTIRGNPSVWFMEEIE